MFKMQNKAVERLRRKHRYHALMKCAQQDQKHAICTVRNLKQLKMILPVQYKECTLTQSPVLLPINENQ